MSNACLIVLPVELLYRIFDYLDVQTILRSIRSVCRKFYAIVDSYNRYELNFYSMKESDILFISRVIRSDNITSLILHNHNPYQTQYERFLTYSAIFYFAKLHSLVIREMNVDNYISTLQNFIGCPLLSLSIHIPEQTNSTTIERMLSMIVQFNLQKIYLHNLDFKFEHISWLSQCPLQHLTIETCSYNVYHEILCHFLHLRSFVINDWTINDTNQSIVRIDSQLTYLSIGNCGQSSSNLEYLLSLTPALVHLKLVSFRPIFHSIFNHSYWEKFIRIKLSRLRKFEFFFTFDLKYLNKKTKNDINRLIPTFQTPFWTDDQRCLVICDYVLEKTKFRFYTTPICIDDFDKQSIRCEISTRDNVCRLILPSIENVIDSINIKTLTIACNEHIQIQFSPIQLFINALRENKIQTLTTLNLSSSLIEDDGAQHLAEALQEQKKLTKLDLSSNQIGDNGAQHLAEALQEHQTLTILDLGSNQIGNNGVQHLANALRKNKTLTTLLLSNNQIGDDGAQHLAEVLRKKKTIAVLTLHQNRIKDIGVQYLADALRSNETLIRLHLSHNRITDNGAEQLADALRQNKTLAKLYLSNTEIGDDGAQYLANALLQTQSLTTLMLCTKRITKTGAQYLVNAALNNTKLIKVGLSRKSVGSASTYLWEEKHGTLQFF